MPCRQLSVEFQRLLGCLQRCLPPPQSAQPVAEVARQARHIRNGVGVDHAFATTGIEQHAGRGRRSLAEHHRLLMMVVYQSHNRLGDGHRAGFLQYLGKNNARRIAGRQGDFDGSHRQLRKVQS